jgi:hypothetical protein
MPELSLDIFTLFGDDDGLGVEVQPVTPVRTKGDTEQRFEAFHRMNPHVYGHIVEIALDLKGRGFTKGGMKMVFERLRWLYAIQTVGEEYKLNNNYTAYYARLVMETVPSLDGFFVTRLRQGQDPYVPDLVALGFSRRVRD